MSPTLRLTVGSGLARAELLGRKGCLWEAATPCETPAELREAIGHLAGEPGLPRRGGRMRVVVTMGSPVVQVRSLRGLPPVRSPSFAPWSRRRRAATSGATANRW